VCAFRRVKESLRGLVERPAPSAVGQPGRLIVGLGNPGPGYARHRHNVGFMVVDRFAARHGFRFGKREANALVATGTFDGEPLALAKPQAFMNRSGEPVRALVRRYTRGPADLIVVYDEMDLPLGRLRIRKEGSHGGHNGMRDVIAALGTQDVVRVRLGVGRPPGGDSVDHVLSPFTPDERPVVDAMIDAGVAALESILRDGVDAAMNLFNRTSGSPPGPDAAPAKQPPSRLGPPASGAEAQVG
jgi:peptidyl-tRNA hydrolase, PTH1 family